MSILSTSDPFSRQHLSDSLEQLTHSIKELHHKSTIRQQKTKSIHHDIHDLKPTSQSTLPIQTLKRDISCDAMKFNVNSLNKKELVCLQDIDTRTSDFVIQDAIKDERNNESVKSNVNDLTSSLPVSPICESQNGLINGSMEQQAISSDSNIEKEVESKIDLCPIISMKVLPEYKYTESPKPRHASTKQQKVHVVNMNSTKETRQRNFVSKTVPNSVNFKEISEKTRNLDNQNKEPQLLVVEIPESTSFMSVSSASTTSTISIKTSKSREIQLTNIASQTTQINQLTDTKIQQQCSINTSVSQLDKRSVSPNSQKLLLNKATQQSSLASHSASLLHAQTLQNFDSQKELHAKQIDWQVILL